MKHSIAAISALSATDKMSHDGRRGMMSDKKCKSSDMDKKCKPTAGNDQLGENAGEGRFEKTVSSKGNKCR